MWIIRGIFIYDDDHYHTNGYTMPMYAQLYTCMEKPFKKKKKKKKGFCLKCFFRFSLKTKKICNGMVNMDNNNNKAMYGKSSGKLFIL